MSKEKIEHEEKEIVVAPVSSTALTAETEDLFGGSTGFENLTTKDFKYGYLSIAQPLCKRANAVLPGYIEGLTPGMWFNSQNSFVYDSKVKLHFVSQKFTTYKEVEPGSKSKFVRVVPAEEFNALLNAGTIIQEGSSFKGLAKGNLIKVSENFFVIPADNPEHGPVLLSFSPGSFKYIRPMVTMMNQVRKADGTPFPIFSFVWELGLGTEMSRDDEPYFTIGSGGTTLVRNVGRVDQIYGLERGKMVRSAFEDFQRSIGEQKFVAAGAIDPNEDTLEHDDNPL